MNQILFLTAHLFPQFNQNPQLLKQHMHILAHLIYGVEKRFLA